MIQPVASRAEGPNLVGRASPIRTEVSPDWGDRNCRIRGAQSAIRIGLKNFHEAGDRRNKLGWYARNDVTAREILTTIALICQPVRGEQPSFNQRMTRVFIEGLNGAAPGSPRRWPRRPSDRSALPR